MASLSKKEEKERELLDYIGSDHVKKVRLSMCERVVSIFFQNGLKVNLEFDHNYRFDKLLLKNDLEDVFRNGVYLSDGEEDEALLKFIFNVVQRKAESFIFYCERVIMEYHKDK